MPRGMLSDSHTGIKNEPTACGYAQARGDFARKVKNRVSVLLPERLSGPAALHLRPPPRGCLQSAIRAQSGSPFCALPLAVFQMIPQRAAALQALPRGFSVMLYPCAQYGKDFVFLNKSNGQVANSTGQKQPFSESKRAKSSPRHAKIPRSARPAGPVLLIRFVISRTRRRGSRG